MTISLNDLWSEVLERLQLQLSRPTFETWIKTATAETLENDCLILQTPNPFARNWIQKYYLKTISDVVEEILGHRVDIQIEIASSTGEGETEEQAVLTTFPTPIRSKDDEVQEELQTNIELDAKVPPPPPPEPKSPKKTAAKPSVSTGINSPVKELNSKYVFSRYVVGPNNRMAHAACLAVAESPGQEFNPLFLCGGVGLGKTHLMQAIGHYRLEICPSSNIFYVSTEKFTNDLIAAIRKDSMQSFREHYRARPGT